MLRVMDLFSGIGGMSLGLEMTGGFRTVLFSENNAHAQRVLARHWPSVEIAPDVKELEYHGDVDIITSGDPCQRDSRANAGRDGQSMWPWTYRQIQRHRPVYVLRENVPGNVETGTLGRVERDLERAGYAVRTYVISARALGAAHDRSRTWTLAYSDRARREKLHNAPEPSPSSGWVYPVLARANGLCWVGSEPPVLRRADDVPHRVDRITRLGNAVVPRIPYVFGVSMLRHLSSIT